MWRGVDGGWKVVGAVIGAPFGGAYCHGSLGSEAESALLIVKSDDVYAYYNACLHIRCKLGQASSGLQG